MRWPVYFLILYVMLGLQVGLGDLAQFKGVGPNLVLLMVVFISLSAPREEALLGAVILGLMQDLVSLQPLGLFAVSYGAVAYIVTAVAPLASHRHPLTHVAMTFVGACLTGLLLILHDRIHPIAAAVNVEGETLRAVRVGPRVAAVMIVYTTLLSPVVIWLLQRTETWFDFRADGGNRVSLRVR